MNDYFLNRIYEVETIVAEFKGYFEERKNAAKRFFINKKIEPVEDSGSYSYLLPDDMDPDDFIDQIMIINTRGAEKKGGETMPALKEGSINKRKDGRWRGRYYDNGVRKYLYARTKAEIITKMNDAILERDKSNAGAIVSKKITLAAWLDEWLIVYKKPRLRTSSFLNLVSYSKPIRESAFGRKIIAKLTAFDFEKFLLTLPAAQRANAYAVLYQALNDFARSRFIKENPLLYVSKPKTAPPAEKIIPTAQEMRIILTKIKEISFNYWLLFSLLYYTGMRRGEALALTWADIDFDKQIVWVRKSYNVNTKETTPPKSKASIRAIPLVETTIDILNQTPRSESPLVFYFINKTACVQTIRQLLNKTGYPKISLHSFRHAFATRCLEAGIEGKVVQKWLGHAKYSVTIDTYSHINAGFERTEKSKLADIWRKKDD